MSHKDPETFEGLLKDLALGQIYLQEDLAFFLHEQQVSARYQLGSPISALQLP